MIEGWWPAPLSRLREILRRRLSDRADRDTERLRELAGRSAATPDEVALRARLTLRLQRFPANPAQRMPTGVSNVLRAAEARPGARYGLDAVVCWPRLWLLLPETSREEVVRARTSLYLTVQVWMSGLALTLWTYWAWWALPVGLSICVVTYYLWMIPAAGTFGKMMVSCYDVHRTLLYTALRWPLPENPRQEPARGRQITAYLATGSHGPSPTFTPGGTSPE